MAKMTFEFDREKLQKAGLTENEILFDVREYAKKYQVAETSFGVFEKDGEDALCLMMIMADKVLTGNNAYITTNSTAYKDYLKSLILDDGDEKEDWAEFARQPLNQTETEYEEEEERIISKLTFEFDREKLQKAGLTENQILFDVREYAKKYQVAETSFGVFEKDGEDALCLMMIMADKVLTGNDAYIHGKGTAYINYLKSLILDDGDEKEDWVKLTKERLN